MRKTLLILTMIIAAAFTAAAQYDFAKTVKAEIETTGPQSLEIMDWQEGTTPLVELQVLKNGSPLAVDPDITARMVIGSSATAAQFSSQTHTHTADNSYFMQWDAISTNTADGAWWYTVYLEDDSDNIYWTGNGDLYIEATTSTGSYEPLSFFEPGNWDDWDMDGDLDFGGGTLSNLTIAGFS